MTARERAIVTVLDKLSGVRATMARDERDVLDALLVGFNPDAASEVEAHQLEVGTVQPKVQPIIQAGSIRLKDDAYQLIETAR